MQECEAQVSRAGASAPAWLQPVYTQALEDMTFVSLCVQCNAFVEAFLSDCVRCGACCECLASSLRKDYKQKHNYAVTKRAFDGVEELDAKRRCLAEAQSNLREASATLKFQ